MKIQAVLFDMGNTLVKYDASSLEEVFRRVLASLDFHRTLGEIKEALTRTEKEFENSNYQSLFGKIPCDEYWHKWDSSVLKHLDFPDNERLARDIQTRWFDYINCEAYPNAIRILSKLKRMGLKTGLISAAYEEEIAVILGKVKLPKRFLDVIVGADTIKKVKPHPDVFRYALRKLKVRPEETLFVGDSVDADYEGAEKAGIKAILIQRTKNYPGKTQVLRTIANLKEIFKYV